MWEGIRSSGQGKLLKRLIVRGWGYLARVPPPLQACSYKPSVVITSSLSKGSHCGGEPFASTIAGCQQDWETPRKGIPKLWRPWSLGHRKSCLYNFLAPKQGGPGCLGSLGVEELAGSPSCRWAWELWRPKLGT